MITAVVAAGCVLLALPGGAYSLEVTAVFGIAVWAVALVGLAVGVFPLAAPGRLALGAGGCLALLGLVTGLSMVWADDPGRAFDQLPRAAAYAGLFALVVLASAPGDGRPWLAGLALGVGLVGGLAVASRLHPPLFPDQHLATFLPAARARLSYPLNYWNGLAALMALGAVLLAWHGAEARTRLGRAATTAWLPVLGLGLFLTSSRGGVAALGVGFAVLLVLGPRRVPLVLTAALGGAGTAMVVLLAERRDAFVDGRLESRLAADQGHELLLALVLTVAVVAALRLALDGPARRLSLPRAVRMALALAATAAVLGGVIAADPASRIDTFTDPPAAPGPQSGFVARHLASAEGTGRYQFWESGFDAFKDRPVLGLGAGSYEAWWARHGTVGLYVRDAHSLVVESMAELGLVGLLLVLGFVGLSVAGGLRRLRGEGREMAVAGLAALACAGASASTDWTYELPAAFAPGVLIAALLAGPAVGGASEGGRRGRGWGFVTAAVGWTAVWVCVVAFVGAREIERSQESARAGDLASALEDAEAAAAIQPWSAAPRLQAALVEERAGDLRAAGRSLAQALDRAPENWRLWVVAVRLRVRTGDVAGARRALRRLRVLNPRSSLLLSGDPVG